MTVIDSSAINRVADLLVERDALKKRAEKAESDKQMLLNALIELRAVAHSESVEWEIATQAIQAAKGEQK